MPWFTQCFVGGIAWVLVALNYDTGLQTKKEELCGVLIICIETNVVNVIYIPDELVLKNL